MSTSWALIAGGSHSEVPLVYAARRLGHLVATLGAHADGEAHTISDKAFITDFSRAENIANAWSEIQPAALIPGCNDYSYLACAEAMAELGKSQDYGFDSPEVAARLHHKDRFRQVQHDAGVPYIKSAVVDDQASTERTLRGLEFPLIVKPVDLSGGKGIEKVTNSIQLRGALAGAFQGTRAQRVVVEEYLDGTHHSLFLMQVGGEARFTYFADEYFCEHAPFLVCGAYTTISLPTDVRQAVVAQSLRIVRGLSLVDGLIHIQFIWNEGQPPFIIEATRRSPGDLYLQLVERCTDQFVLNALVDFHGGGPGDALSQGLPEGGKAARILRHCVWAQSDADLGLTLQPGDTPLLPTGGEEGLEKRAIIFRTFNQRPSIPGR